MRKLTGRFFVMSLAVLLAPDARAVQLSPLPEATIIYGRGGEDDARMAASQDTLLAGKPSFVGGKVGSVRTWTRDPDTQDWGPASSLAGGPGQGLFGYAVDVAGDRAIVGVPNFLGPGTAYVFERDLGGAWNQVQQLGPGQSQAGNFGEAVAIEGDVAAVGAPHQTFAIADGALFIFERDPGGTWNEVAVHYGFQTFLAAAGYGKTVSVSGDAVAVGGWYVDVYTRDSGGPGAWGKEQLLGLNSPINGFGERVALEGDLLAVGAPVFNGPGTLAIYERTGANPPWVEQAVFSAGPIVADGYAEDVVIADGRVAAGAPLIDHPGLPADGTVFVYSKTTGTWALEQMLLPPSASLPVTYGQRLAADGSTLFVREDDRPLGPDKLSGLALDEATGVVYGIDPESKRLVTVHPDTGVTKVLSQTTAVQPEGLAFDPVGGILYASDTANDELVTIDPATGVTTSIGPIGFQRVRGLAFDSSTGTLFGADDPTDQLITIDVGTGAGTAVGPLGFPTVRGLAFDSATGMLYATDKAGAKQLFSVDPATGASTAIGPTGYFELRGLAAHPSGSALIGANHPADDLDPRELVTLDPATGAGSLLALYNPDPSLPNVGRVIHVYEECGRATSYCTAGTSASGCQAAISSIGTPSASATSGFTLSATAFEGSTTGQFFWGTSGRQANPWGNGTSLQCVVPPIARAGLLGSSGTAGLCDGTATQDLAALWTAKPGKNPGGGATVQAQYWYRDPSSTSSQKTSLSDALEFSVCP